MVSDPDKTARSRILDSALALFADRGVDATTIRDIAAGAGVSAPLVLHHYKSKADLVSAVHAHVLGIFDSLLGDPDAPPDDGRVDMEAESASLAEQLLAHIPPGSPIPAYLRRVLLSGEEEGAALFQRWFERSRDLVAAMEAAGASRPTNDPDVRAAFLLVNDLAMVVFHGLIADSIGSDPLTPHGMERWAAEAVDAYTEGIFTKE